MQLAKTSWLWLCALAGLSACFSQSVKPPKDTDPLAEAPSADPAMLAARDTPPPPVHQDAPDMDFLRDMAKRSARQAAKCDAPANSGPRGTAKVEVTFEPIGRSGKVLVAPPHEGTPIGSCIKRAFEGVIVTPFNGQPVVVEQDVVFVDKKEPSPASSGSTGH